ncbi:MAG: BamA/TamA family outer membrane protein [Myxococcota bacterium]
MLFLPLLLACATARHRAEGDIVRHVDFAGNGGVFSGHNDYQLRQQMQQPHSRWGVLVWPFLYTVDPRTLDPERLVRDAYRLEVWYAHHGWFDARVEGWSLEQVRRATRRLAPVYDIHGLVRPGDRSTLRALDVEGLPPALQALKNATLREAPIRPGDPFDLELVEDTRAALERALHDHARPYATVDLAVDARPEARVVDATLSAQEGILARFGDVTVEGTEKVPERFVRQAADLEPGAPYSREALERAQRALFGLGTFAIVTVDPDLSDPAAEAVPVNVHVGEAKFRSLRLGGGVDYDGYLPTLRAQLKLRHTNLFHELIRAELGLRAGITLDPQAGGELSGLPTWGVDLGVSYPRLVGGRASLDLKGTVEQNVYTGLWAYRRPIVDLGATWRFDEAIQLRVGPHFEVYTFIGDLGDAQTARQQRLFGLDTGDDFQYELTALDQLLTIDWTNDPLKPNRGSHTTLSLREAAPLSDRGYGFVRGTGEVKRYVPLRAGGDFPFTLVGRLRATAIVPYGATTQIPLPERAFLGGATSIRGFRQNQVGPYQTLCTYQTVTKRSGFLGLGGQVEGTEKRVVRYHLPEGGNVSGEAGLELRYDWAYGVTFAFFGDAGALAPSLAELRGSDLRWSAGVGVRYNTVAGPLRVDVSFRPLYPEDDGPTPNGAIPAYTCKQGGAEPRVYDFFSNFAGLRGTEHPPFATVLYLTFGQAF